MFSEDDNECRLSKAKTRRLKWLDREKSLQYISEDDNECRLSKAKMRRLKWLDREKSLQYISEDDNECRLSKAKARKPRRLDREKSLPLQGNIRAGSRQKANAGRIPNNHTKGKRKI